MRLGRRHRSIVALVLLLAFVLASCAPGFNPVVKTASADGTVAGFIQGVWHGFIAPFTFFVSLFTESVNVYEVHNSGNWYDFGFVLGAGILFGGGAAGSRRRR